MRRDERDEKGWGWGGGQTARRGEDGAAAAPWRTLPSAVLCRVAIARAIVPTSACSGMHRTALEALMVMATLPW